jgi:toxin CcdB
MPEQLDVHHNPGRNRRAVPFVVIVQSNRFRLSVRRVVVPLVAAEAFGQADSDFGPHCVIEDPRVVLDPLQITNLPRDLLGPPVLSLAGEDTRIINAWMRCSAAPGGKHRSQGDQGTTSAMLEASSTRRVHSSSVAVSAAAIRLVISSDNVPNRRSRRRVRIAASPLRRPSCSPS